MPQITPKRIPRHAPFVRGWRLLCGSCLLLLACAPSPRQPITGQVTLDGEPLSSGYISFRPLPDTPGPTAGAQIVAGHYAIPAAQGLFSGRFQVQIVATRPTSRPLRDPLEGLPGTAVEQYLPARYNTQSELRIELTADSAPRNFHLSSRPEEVGFRPVQ